MATVAMPTELGGGEGIGGGVRADAILRAHHLWHHQSALGPNPVPWDRCCTRHHRGVTRQLASVGMGVVMVCSRSRTRAAAIASSWPTTLSQVWTQPPRAGIPTYGPTRRATSGQAVLAGSGRF